MLKCHMLFHRNNPTLLVICNHTFPLLYSITKIMCLGDKVANHKMHGLNSSSREFTTIIDHKKYQERDPIVRDSKHLIQRQLCL